MTPASAFVLMLLSLEARLATDEFVPVYWQDVRKWKLSEDPLLVDFYRKTRLYYLTSCPRLDFALVRIDAYQDGLVCVCDVMNRTDGELSVAPSFENQLLRWCRFSDSMGNVWTVPRFEGCVIHAPRDEVPHITIRPKSEIRIRLVNRLGDPQFALERDGMARRPPSRLAHASWWTGTALDRKRNEVRCLWFGKGETEVVWHAEKCDPSQRSGLYK